MTPAAPVMAVRCDEPDITPVVGIAVFPAPDGAQTVRDTHAGEWHLRIVKKLAASNARLVRVWGQQNQTLTHIISFFTPGLEQDALACQRIFRGRKPRAVRALGQYDQLISLAVVGHGSQRSRRNAVSLSSLRHDSGRRQVP
jgi:hypothetical protein